MINIVSPGLLGTPKQFGKIFSEVIVKSRDKRCADHDQRLGRKKLRELSKLTQPLMLRRTMADKAISATMPAKMESLVFCVPSLLQQDLYRALLLSAETQKALRENKQGGAFAVITRVIKLLNHPTLLLRQEKAAAQSKEDEITDLTLGGDLGSIAATVAVDMDFVKRHFPADYDQQSLVHSSKLSFVFDLLKQVQSSTSDRCVLVSNYTTTLDLLESFCTASRYALAKSPGALRTAVFSAIVYPGADLGGVAATSMCGWMAACQPTSAGI